MFVKKKKCHYFHEIKKKYTNRQTAEFFRGIQAKALHALRGQTFLRHEKEHTPIGL